MRTILAVAALGGMVLGGALGFISWRAAAAAAEDRIAERVVVTIPAGTAARLASGDPTASEALAPASVRLATGDTLLVRNEDAVTHSFGAWSIAPGAVLELAAEPSDSGAFGCSFTTGGSFAVTVVPPLTPASVMVPAGLVGLPLGMLVGVLVLFVRRLDGPDSNAEGPTVIASA